ncbi:uncharacterized protein [Littorina saxatilis]|uniref:Fibrinogen C-terminal domain-containing protein n=1 Tax=Littorina saxatilis TaxID=31220 RepID=A0AAN9B614_9CAEN
MKHCFVICLIAFSFSSVLQAYRWSPTPDNDARVGACVGGNISFQWSIVTDGKEEQIIDIDWLFEAPGKANVSIASYGYGNIFTKANKERFTFTPNAGLHLQGAQTDDAGRYYVKVILDDPKGRLTSAERMVTLSVTDRAPAVQNDAFLITMSDAIWDDVIEDWTLQLRCGRFVDFGHPPVDVIWTMPSGEVRNSSHEDNGTFVLSVSSPVQGGNYSCHLPPSAPAARCLTATSPLTAATQLYVDDKDVRLSLLELLVHFDKMVRVNSDQANLLQNQSLFIQEQASLLQDQDSRTQYQASLPKHQDNCLQGQDKCYMDHENRIQILDSLYQEHRSLLKNHSLSIQIQDSRLKNQSRFTQDQAGLLKDHDSRLEDQAGLLQNQSQLIQEKASLLQALDSRLQDQESLLQNQSLFIQDQASLLQALDSRLQDEESLLKNQSLFIEDQASLRQNQSLFIQDQASLLQALDSRLQNQSLFIQDQASLLQNQSFFIQDQASLLRALDSRLQDQESLLQNQSLFIQDQTSLLQNQTFFIQDQTSLLTEQDNRLQNLSRCIQDQTSHQDDIIDNLKVEMTNLKSQFSELNKKADAVQGTFASCVDWLAVDPRSGVRTLTVHGEAIRVYCDQTTDGGGWTVFQRRQDQSVDFYKGWEAYRSGFGDLQGNFWLGLDKLHNMTSSGDFLLRIDLQKFDGTNGSGIYTGFHIAGVDQNFRLNFDSFAGGNAGDSLSYHNKQQFSTHDADHDTYSGNCAREYHGAWWYKICYHSHLNGRYKDSRVNGSDGVRWRHFDGSYSLKFSEMKMRPS